jgi:hypothetical protein
MIAIPVEDFDPVPKNATHPYLLEFEFYKRKDLPISSLYAQGTLEKLGKQT